MLRHRSGHGPRKEKPPCPAASPRRPAPPPRAPPQTPRRCRPHISPRPSRTPGRSRNGRSSATVCTGRTIQGFAPPQPHATRRLVAPAIPCLAPRWAHATRRLTAAPGAQLRGLSSMSRRLVAPAPRSRASPHPSRHDDAASTFRPCSSRAAGRSRNAHNWTTVYSRIGGCRRATPRAGGSGSSEGSVDEAASVWCVRGPLSPVRRRQTAPVEGARLGHGRDVAGGGRPSGDVPGA